MNGALLPHVDARVLSAGDVSLCSQTALTVETAAVMCCVQQQIEPLKVREYQPTDQPTIQRISRAIFQSMNQSIN